MISAKNKVKRISKPTRAAINKGLAMALFFIPPATENNPKKL